ncbi:hypothetical protein CACET_c31990 [Clostridium aceticum]|uniref:Uncharacterized protein n=1 Tax=Clostridium aceticum TaxID=84022 RepID=A0A0D8I735_9CLOT|nr:hypothetical protein [Clostridium aceticum]AKL96643.1 hypothetical protein CACET_c31990 [Clostridium aceticum]KJF26058.1 hypothetical protein TZ02_15140 [Clostridium aceticum]
MDKLIIGEFKGCGACDLCKENQDCRKMDEEVEITFKKSQKSDNWGKAVTVFSKGEIVTGRAVIKENRVYCASAKSNIFGGYEDFVSLENVEIKRLG